MRALPLPFAGPVTVDQTSPLEDLHLIVLDGQSNGASPRAAQLIELVWCRAPANEDEPSLEGGLLRLEPGAGLPRSVASLTGLEERDLAGAPSPLDRWRALCASAASLGSPAPALIHYARFEEPFLRALHATTDAPFPLDIFCVHAIAERLLPELPRRGLRALAGYLGVEAPSRHRAGEHVRATRAVWKALLPRLLARGLRTQGDLRRWLESPRPRRRTWSFPLDRVLRLELPVSPGVYHLLGPRGELLYVGKAASLRDRVNSHFRGRRGRAERELELLTRTRDLEVELTGSAVEAALLEADEIRRLAPPYNRALRDRGEVPCFIDRALRSVSRQPGAGPWLGPVLGARSHEVLLLLARLADGESPPADRWRSALSLPDLPRGPADRLIAEGVALLAGRLGLHGCRAPRLLRIGARIWREQASSSSSGESPPLLEPPPPRRWTAARVAEALELALCRGAHLLRRGAFLVELGESTLRWQRATGEQRTLRIEAGRVLAGKDAASPREVPRSQRADSLDAAACERLRVLTTELRRLCREGRTIELRLGARRPLDRERLARRLFWI